MGFNNKWRVERRDVHDIHGTRIRYLVVSPKNKIIAETSTYEDAQHLAALPDLFAVCKAMHKLAKSGEIFNEVKRLEAWTRVDKFIKKVSRTQKSTRGISVGNGDDE